MNSFRAQQTGSAYKKSVGLSFSELWLRFKHFMNDSRRVKTKYEKSIVVKIRQIRERLIQKRKCNW